jgi:hypothetical protein
MGEVHPVVQTLDEHFRIGFRKNSYTPGEGWDQDYLKRVFIRDYNLKGESIGQVQEITGQPTSEDFILDKSHFNTDYKVPENWNIWRVIAINENRSVLLSYRSPQDLEHIENLFKKSPNTASEELMGMDQELSLFIVDQRNSELITQHTLGSYRDVAYGFPAVSNIVVSGDYLYVVWNQSNGWKYEERISYGPVDPFAEPISTAPEEKNTIKVKVHNPPTMTLTTYNIRTDVLESKTLPYPSHWNTHISIGLIDTSLCIAYHGLSETLSVNMLDITNDKI